MQGVKHSDFSITIDVDLPVFNSIFLGAVDVAAKNRPILAFENDFPPVLFPRGELQRWDRVFARFVFSSFFGFVFLSHLAPAPAPACACATLSYSRQASSAWASSATCSMSSESPVLAWALSRAPLARLHRQDAGPQLGSPGVCADGPVSQTSPFHVWHHPNRRFGTFLERLFLCVFVFSHS